MEESCSNDTKQNVKRLASIDFDYKWTIGDFNVCDNYQEKEYEN